MQVVALQPRQDEETYRFCDMRQSKAPVKSVEALRMATAPHAVIGQQKPSLMGAYPRCGVLARLRTYALSSC